MERQWMKMLNHDVGIAWIEFSRMPIGVTKG
jgi:hypothetical protein